MATAHLDRTRALGPPIITTPSYTALAEVVGQLPQIILLSQLHSLILFAKNSKTLEFATQDAVAPKEGEDDKQQWTILYEQMTNKHSPGIWSESPNTQWAVMGKKHLSCSMKSQVIEPKHGWETYSTQHKNCLQQPERSKTRMCRLGKWWVPHHWKCAAYGILLGCR